MTGSKSVIVSLTLAVLGMAGCAQSKVATILEKDNAQLALALNKDGSVTVVGIRDGVRVKPCEVSPSPLTQDAGRAGAVPDEKALAQCFPDGHVPGKILFQQNYTITVREGSKCIDVWVNGMVYVLCDPPYRVSYN